MGKSAFIGRAEIAGQLEKFLRTRGRGELPLLEQVFDFHQHVMLLLLRLSRSIAKLKQVMASASSFTLPLRSAFIDFMAAFLACASVASPKPEATSILR